MIDTSAVNLLSLIERDTHLRKVASTRGSEYHGPCPFCGGRDRFVVQPSADTGGRWSCRQCSPRWQDAIAYVQQRDGCNFREALATLDLSGTWPPTTPARRPPSTPAIPTLRNDYPALNDPAWQQCAQQLVETCQAQLWSRQGTAALNYLRQRGLTEAVIQQAQLGYLPDAHYSQWGAEQVGLPAGIVIPWFKGDTLWRIRIRRLGQGSDSKYTQAKGGANGLYGVDALTANCVAVLLEGEFDALVLRAHVPTLDAQPVVAVATGGTQNARLFRWQALLGITQQVLVAFDSDEAGEQAADWWLTKLPKAKRLRPTAHDVTDMHLTGEDLRAWMTDKLITQP